MNKVNDVIKNWIIPSRVIKDSKYAFSRAFLIIMAIAMIHNIKSAEASFDFHIDRIGEDFSFDYEGDIIADMGIWVNTLEAPTINDGTAMGTVTVTNLGHHIIDAQTYGINVTAGDVTIISDSTIKLSTITNSSSAGVRAIAGNTTGNAHIEYDGAEISLISNSGADSFMVGIQASNELAQEDSSNSGYASVTASGNISVINDNSTGPDFMYGIESISYGLGDASIHYSNGHIYVESQSTIPNYGFGLLAQSAGTGNVSVKTETGTSIETKGNNISGIRLLSSGGLTSLYADISSIISTNGNNAHGIEAIAGGVDSQQSIEVTNFKDITTNGENSNGIYISSLSSSDIKITNRGSIYTQNDNSSLSSVGILAINNTTGASDGMVIVQNGGEIKTHSYDGHGISAVSSASSGDMNVVLNSASIKLTERGSDGINVQNHNTGMSTQSINITTIDGSIDTFDGATASSLASKNNYGIAAVQRYDAQGNINIHNDGTAITTGTNSDGSGSSSDAIAAVFSVPTPGGVSNATGNINIYNYGDLITHDGHSRGIRAQHVGLGNIAIENYNQVTTKGVSSHGISAIISNDTSKGMTSIENIGNINTEGQNANAIHATSVGAGSAVIIANEGNLYVADAKGINASSINGNVRVTNSGRITTAQATASTQNYGMDISSHTGKVTVVHNSMLQVNGNTAGGGDTIGIVAWDGGSGNATQESSITLGSKAIIDANHGVGALQIRTNGTGTLNVNSGAKVHGGHNTATGKGYAIGLEANSGTTAAQFEINNAGLIDALSDHLVTGSAAVDSTLVIRNAVTGVMNGYLSLENIETTVANEGIWNIRHFADTTGNGIRDTKAVAVTDFGGGNGVIKNEKSGTINLSEVPLTTRMPVNHDTSYLGYQTAGALDISDAGIVQGHLVNVTRLENRGTINLTENGQAGDVFVITSNATAMSTAGNSTFVADGGFVKLDTVLNEGGANSLSDILVVDNVEAGTQKTTLIINHVGGVGALTKGDGIKVVEVLGTAESGSFELGNVVRTGLYEYTLFEGSKTVASDNSLFLRSSSTQINPDVGSYLANQAAATGLFMHTLHDRLSEAQYHENYLSEDKTIPALWIRAISGYTKNEAAAGRLKQHSIESLIHLGGEIANWTRNSEDRYHLGIMGAYGRSETKTKSKETGSRVNSTVDGYGVGAYLTWYDQPTAIDGWYGDLWSMYSWLENKTEGSEKYDSNSWTVSLELGYASKLKSTQNYYWMIEPQAQVAYNHYRVDKIEDHNELNIINHDKGSVTTRLGVKTYLRPNELYHNSAQPFVEINWWNADHKNSMLFDGEKVSGDTPRNRFEVKVGVQGEMTKNVQIYSHIGMQWGKDSYEHTEGQLGLRYRF